MDEHPDEFNTTYGELDAHAETPEPDDIRDLTGDYDGMTFDENRQAYLQYVGQVADGRPATTEERITRALRHALPGLDFHTNTTSTTAVRIYAKPQGEHRKSPSAALQNDAIAVALRLAGFHIARRGPGQAVYAHTGRSEHAVNDGTCERPGHEGEPAPWIAVLPGETPLGTEYACHACVLLHVMAERAFDAIRTLPAGTLVEGRVVRTGELVSLRLAAPPHHSPNRPDVTFVRAEGAGQKRHSLRTDTISVAVPASR